MTLELSAYVFGVLLPLLIFVIVMRQYHSTYYMILTTKGGQKRKYSVTRCLTTKEARLRVVAQVELMSLRQAKSMNIVWIDRPFAKWLDRFFQL